MLLSYATNKEFLGIIAMYLSIFGSIVYIYTTLKKKQR
jgi:hypothetical protein